MKVFADTLYWVAVTNPRDSWHMTALDTRTRLGNITLITTEEVLTEFLTALSGAGPFLRGRAVQITQTLLRSNNLIVLPQSHSTFIRGLELYAQRQDKQYSLTDCISMNAMRDEGIMDILTNDHHFAQEGFNVLISKD